MALATITVQELSTALRLPYDLSGTTIDPETLNILNRILQTSSEFVENYAPEAPENTKNEAICRTSAVLYDQISGGFSYSGMAAARNGGALALLSPWKVRRINLGSD